MPAEPAPLSPSLRAPLAPARLGPAERVALVILAAIALVLLAAWQIPPRLDWSRYRGTIASYASTRLGRPVSIAGGVRLMLLPRPMLLADRVTLADRGDGVSATIGTMRLEVALSSLLALHVVPRSLSLDDPSATLPWPPPRGAASHLPARVPGSFSAVVNGGTLILGGIPLHDITATLHTDPDTGAFAAEGNARVAGLPWRFTALLGAPGSDGISPLSLTLDGRAASRAGGLDMRGTGGTFQGRLLADGQMDGTLVLRGPDLSRLGAGPPLAWGASGRVSADGLSLVAPALALQLAGSPGSAAMLVHLAPPASLSLHAKIAALPVGPWLWRLAQGAAAASVAASIEVDAGAITTKDGTLGAGHFDLSAGAQGVRVNAASVTLPGGARAAATGTILPDGAFDGQLGLQAARLHETLGWLTGQAPSLPPGVLATADLRGAFSATQARLAWWGVQGRLDGGLVTGAISATLGPRPALDIAVNTQRLPLPGWAWPPSLTARSPAALLAPFDEADARFALATDALDWPGMPPLRHAVLRGAGSRAGLTVRRLSFDLPGGHLDASGKLGADASLAEARLDLTAADATALPAAWRVPVGLWQGGFHLGLTGAGPPSAIAATLRADLGDLRAEAEGQVDLPARSIQATATLRHPGAPRLLAALGLPDPRAWLGDGSLAILTHLSVSAGQIRARDFTLAAGALQMGGALAVTLAADGVRFGGRIDAPSLTLPSWRQFPPAGAGLSSLPGWVRGLEGAIDITAGRVLLGLGPVANAASARLVAGGGVALIEDGRAALPQGHAAGALAVDITQSPPAFSLMAQADGLAPDTILPQAPSPPGLALQGGLMDVSAELYGSGTGPAAAEGRVQLGLTASALTGLDLQGGLPPGPARTRVPHAVTGGRTSPLDGRIDAQITHGVASLQGSRLAGPAGEVGLTGTADLASASIDVHLTAKPAGTVLPPTGFTLSGPWDAARMVADPVKTTAPHRGRHRIAK